MSAVDKAFTSCRADGRAALVGYLPVGYPDVRGSIDAMLAMVGAGVDIVEVGVPYSDPLMDGPTIQAAVDAAVRSGTRMRDVLAAVEAVAATGVPAVVMTYWNPVERYGTAAFARDLAAAGGAGAITPDLIPEEAGDWIGAAREHDVDSVFLVAPSSTDERLAMTAQHCRGFVYAASTMGVTGARAAVSDAAGALVARARTVTDLPLAVGLGVRDGAQATQVAAYADGVIVGSALVRRLLDAADRRAGLTGVAELTAELAAGVRGNPAGPPARR